MSPYFKPKLLSIFQEGYSQPMFLKDLLAGLIVGIIALPMSIAFAIASGARPEQGVITAILAGVIAGAFSGSRYQVSGPTGAFVVLVFMTIDKFGYEGLLASMLIAGILLVLMGLFRFGKTLMFVPYPIIVGFTGGIALFIFSAQLHDFLGLSTACKSSPECVALWKLYFTNLDQISPWPIFIGSISIFTASQVKRVPGSLAAIIITTGLVYIFSIPIETIGDRFGTLTISLPNFSFPNLSLSNFSLYITPAIGIALLAGIESLLSAVVADSMTGKKHRSNEELISQGLANIGSSFIGGLPITGAIARTAANIQSGAVSPVSSIVHSLTIVCMLYFFGNLVTLIPLATLSGILIVVAYKMSEWRSFLKILKNQKADIAILLTTFLLTVFVDLVSGILSGIFLAGIIFIIKKIDTNKIIKTFSHDNTSEEN